MKVRENKNATTTKKDSVIKRTANNYVQRFDFTDRTLGQLVYLSNILDGRVNVCNKRANDLYDTMYKSFVRDFIEQFNFTSKNPVKISENSKFKKAWLSATSAAISGVKRNPIKEAAWVVCHSDKFGYKLTWDEYRTLIPTNGNDTMIVNWNRCIENDLDDVSDEIKNLFIIKDKSVQIFDLLNHNTKAAEDKDRFKEVIVEDKNPSTEISNNAEAIATEKEDAEAKKEFAEVVAELDAEVDDAPEEEAGAEKIDHEDPEEKAKRDKLAQLISEITTMTANKSDLSDDTKAIIYGALANIGTRFIVPDENQKVPAVIDVKPEDITITDADTKKKNAELDAEMKNAIARDDEKDEKKEATEETVAEHPTQGTMFAENNIPWEDRIPKLNILTDICKKKGLGVQYSLCSYPGIIMANIYTVVENNFNVTRQLLIDPMVIYGDTVRVIPITSTNDKFDIRKEMYIPITNKKLVSKAIDGTLSKEDREKFFSNLPRCMSDFRGKYHFLDRIDLRCLTEDGSAINFFSWRTLVTNISKVLASKNIPTNCRFRVVDYKNGNHFELVCDDKVLSSISGDIFNEKDHFDSVAQGLRVEYDVDKYKEGKDGNIHFRVFER